MDSCDEMAQACLVQEESSMEQDKDESSRLVDGNFQIFKQNGL